GADSSSQHCFTSSATFPIHTATPAFNTIKTRFHVRTCEHFYMQPGSPGFMQNSPCHSWPGCSPLSPAKRESGEGSGVKSVKHQCPEPGSVRWCRPHGLRRESDAVCSHQKYSLYRLFDTP